MINWKFTDATNTVVHRKNEDGSQESCLIEAIADWLAEGNEPEPADPVVEPIPQVVSKAQGIAIMSQVVIGDSNLWLKVKACFDTEADEISRDLFYAIQVFNRQSPMLNNLKGLFGLDDAALDRLFIDGAKVVV